MIDLRRLQVLRAVCYYGTVTAAASSLHLTPSAASQQIRQLGRELGVTLLEPHGRRVRLTPAALNLLAHADAIESRWQLAEGELRSTSDQPAGLLRMAGFPTALSALLSPVTCRLALRYPALCVRLREAEPQESFDLLFDGETDLAVVEVIPDGPPIGDQRFDQRPLLDDPFDLLVAEGHPLAERDKVDLAETADDRWILGMPSNSCRQHVLAACNAAGFRPNVAHEAGTWDTVAALVADGLGIALFSRLAQLPPHLPVRKVAVTGTSVPSRKLLTCTRRGARETPLIAAALRVIDDYAAGLCRS